MVKQDAGKAAKDFRDRYEGNRNDHQEVADIAGKWFDEMVKAGVN